MYDGDWIFEILDDDLFLVEVEPCTDILTIILLDGMLEIVL